jgi:hypothetical protein
MQGAGVVGHRLAQLGQAQVVGIEGFALLQRFNRGLADEIGVTSSLSPNQKASTSGRPMPALATSRIFDSSRFWMVWRMP